MNKNPIQIAGIAWYRADDYPRIRQIMVDGRNLPATFEKWSEAAHKLEQAYQSAGQRVVRAFIRPDEFVGWCRTHGLDVDANARQRWGAECARRAAVPGN